MTPDQSIPLISAMLLQGSSAWHPDYTRVVDYAIECRKFATGDVTSLLRVYWQGESEETLQRLFRLYVATCEAAWGELATQFYKVARLRDGQVERKIVYDEALGEAERARFTAAVTQALNGYYNNKPLQDYLAEHIAQTVAMTDPNAWLLTAFDPFDYRIQKARPYPVLLPSSAVVHFTRSAGEVTSMTARYAISNADNTEALHRYTSYLPDHAVDYWPVDSGNVHTIPGGPEAATGVVMEADKVKYHYQVFEHGAGRVPASPLGYVPDQGAQGLVFISPLHRAISWLKLELKTGHELQIVMRNMAMPRQLQYTQACTGYDEYGGCDKGLCRNPASSNPNDFRCPKCHGSGLERLSKSASDVIEIPLSPNPEENKLKLTDMLAFVGPDASIPEFQLKFQDWLSDKVYKAVFGRQVQQKTTGPATATEVADMADQMAVALTPFADWFSGAYVHHGTVAAAYVDAGKGLTLIYDFPDGLDLKSETDLYNQLAAAVAAGVRADEITRIQNAIMRKTHANDPEGLRRYLVRSRFIPTLGIPDQLFIQYVALGKIPEDDQLIRINADRIFYDAELADKNFYKLTPEAQAVAVQAQIDIIKGKLTAPAAAGSFGRLNMTPSAQAAAVPA
ncbi:hypothetical protein [Hymenobacter ruber]